MLTVRQTRIALLLSLAWVVLGWSHLAAAQEQTEPGPKPQDKVVQLRTLDSHFPFAVPDSVEAWNRRAEQLRLHVQMSLGLWPLPERTPLNAVIHGRIDIGDYSVEKVYFESFPGFYVTGNLYRSTKQSPDRRPAILSPHGHYSNGRFYDAGADGAKRAIENGEETFESNARSPLQARCVHLARMGCTVFHYDMVGYADSQQIPASVAHDFQKQRPDESSADGWGFFSPRAEMHLQSIMGLQTWNSMRAIDFVQSLPEVDPDRIGVTGSSGGGTQTFLLAAIDDRVTAAFPAVMVSTGMQGGCTCENCCNLRVGTGNVEIAALFAPKPMGLSSANDWTRTMPEDGFPQLQELYALLGKPENVYLTPSLNFPHGYNQVSRRVMYAWFDRHLKITGMEPNIEKVEKGDLPDDSPWRELEIQLLAKEQLSVWDDAHPIPESGARVEHAVTKFWTKNDQARIQGFGLKDPDTFKSHTLDLLFDSQSSDPFLLAAAQVAEKTIGGFPDISAHQVTADFWTWGPYQFLVCQKQVDDNLATRRPAVILVTSQLIADIIKEPPSILKQLLNGDTEIVVMTGDGLVEANRLVQNGREAAGYTFGYNRSRLADAAAALRSILVLKSIESSRIDLLLTDSTAPIGILAAAAMPGYSFDTICVRDDFRFGSVDRLTHPWFLPGALKMGDVPGLIAIANPKKVVVIGDIRDDLAAQFRDQSGRVVAVTSEEEAIATLLND